MRIGDTGSQLLNLGKENSSYREAQFASHVAYIFCSFCIIFCSSFCNPARPVSYFADPQPPYTTVYSTATLQPILLILQPILLVRHYIKGGTITCSSRRRYGESRTPRIDDTGSCHLHFLKTSRITSLLTTAVFPTLTKIFLLPWTKSSATRNNFFTATDFFQSGPSQQYQQYRQQVAVHSVKSLTYQVINMFCIGMLQQY